MMSKLRAKRIRIKPRSGGSPPAPGFRACLSNSVLSRVAAKVCQPPALAGGLFCQAGPQAPQGAKAVGRMVFLGFNGFRAHGAHVGLGDC
jgi:hypothetical protein